MRPDPAAPGAPLPVTETQRDLLLHHLRFPEDPVFNISGACRLGRGIDPARWAAACRSVLRADPAARLLFRLEEDAAFAVVSDGEPAGLALVPGPLPSAERLDRDNLARRFDLAHGPLVQPTLYLSDEGEAIASFSAPHVLLDGTGLRNLLERTAAAYARIGGDLEPDPVPEHGFVEWLRSRAPGGAPCEREEFWKSRFASAAPPDFHPLPGSGGALRTDVAVIPAEEAAEVRARCERATVWPSAFFLSLYALLLDRTADVAGDLLLFEIVGGRPGRFGRSLGCFYEVAPVIVPSRTLAPASRVDGLLRHVAWQRVKEARGRSAPVSLLNRIAPEGTRCYFNYLNFATVRLPWGETDAHISWSHPDDEVHFIVNDRGGRFELELRYHEDRYWDRRFPARVVEAARQVCAGAAECGLVSPFLEGDAAPPREPEAAAGDGEFRSVLLDFEERARTRPAAVAVSLGSESLTYGELDGRASALARRLVSMGAGPSTTVGLLASRDLSLLEGLLAILKSGAAYLPLDPGLPPERLELMAAECSLSILVTRREYDALVPSVGAGGRVLLDSAPEEGTGADVVLPSPSPDWPAYVIFTSGSTGRPKGTVLTHANLASLFRASDRIFRFGPSDTWTLFHSVGFDFSVWEIWGALRHGGRLVVVPKETVRSPEDFLALLAAERVTVLNQTPSAFAELSRCALEPGAPEPSALELVIFGGEALRVEILRPWIDRYGDRRPRLVNMYGITETTVHVTWKPIARSDLAKAPGSPIGRPIPGWTVEVRNSRGLPLPAGLPGELVVGGPGVAGGYLHRPDLTAERFLPAPGGERLYRSGDLGRLLPDGQLEYLGRVDQQIKIRGFRIEPGEVEAALGRHPGVRACAVTASLDRRRAMRLEAFFVPSPAAPPAAAEVRRFLSDFLPDYMVPSILVPLAAIPLTPNGKVDRAALRRAAEALPSGPTEEPATDLERSVAENFAELLDVPAVGRHDDFFEMGGHSLLATQLVARLRERHGVTIPIGSVFESPTPAALARRLEDRLRDGSRRDTSLPYGPPPASGRPLSFSQERLWFLHQLEPENLAYSFQATLSIDGRLDVAALRESLAFLVARHEVYRTTFPAVGGIPVQVIHPPWRPELPVVDAGGPGEVDRLVAAEIERPWNLEELPLARWTLYRLGDERHVLLHAEHHLLHDGWAFAVFLRELVDAYRAICRGEAPALLPLPVSFADFALAQRRWIEGEEGRRQLEYWKEKLRGLPPLLDLPTDRPRPAVQSHRGSAIRTDVPVSLAAALQSFSRREGITLFMTLFSGFAALLHRLTGAEDVPVGSGVANRRWRETEGLLGMIINTVVLRMDFSGEPTFRSLLDQARRVTIEAGDSQDVPFGQVVEALRPERSTSHSPLFQVLFGSYDGPAPDLRAPGLSIALTEGINNGSVKFDLNVVVVARTPAPGTGAPGLPPSITVLWEYDTDLFDRATMERWLSTYFTLLEAAVAQPATPVARLSLLRPGQEREVQAYSRPGEGSPGPSAASIPACFDLVAARFPGRTAVVCGDQTLSYRELDASSDRIARLLRSRGVGPEVVVGVATERSPLLVPALLGVLKAGGAYLPVDPSDPASRNAYLLADARVPLVLADSRTAPALPEVPGCERIELDLLEPDAGSPGPSAAGPGPSPDQLACVLYTSGSTGRPKGVEVLHRNVVRLVSNVSWIPLDGEETFLQLAPLSFDASTFEIWGPLLNGGRLVLYPGREFDPDLFGDTVRAHGVTTLWLTASLFNRIVDASPELLAGVRRILTGGEAVSVVHVRRAQALLPTTRFYNGYGPTEGTTFTTVWEIPRPLPDLRSVPIGRPIDRTAAWVLDPSGGLVPPLVPGELFAGGDGVARGYRGLPALTAERFLPDPRTPGGRLYRTGDRVRFLAGGEIEFLGRLDRQLKIRGHRIEPAEVESVLGGRSDLLEVAVVPRPSPTGSLALTAYFVPRPGDAPSADALRSWLRERLPDYMVPSFFVRLERLPVTANGKLDVAALPAPSPEGRTGPAAAESAIEAVVSDLFADVLELREVPPDEGFFDLGGHSLLALSLLSRLREAFGVVLPVRTFFSGPSVRETAREVAAIRARAGGAPASSGPLSVVPVRPGGSLPPFFLAPGGDGGEGALLVYARLARHLDAEQPFWGLVWQAPAEGRRKPPRAREMARLLVREIRRVRPAGPYRIGGECIGGALAWEIASQLSAEGEEVALLLLDSRRPSPRGALRLEVRTACSWIRRTMTERIARERREGRVRIPNARERVLDWISPRLPYSEDDAPATVLPEWTAYQRVLVRHLPAKAGFPVTLLLSRVESLKSADLGWSPIAAGGFRVEVVPGDHSTYIRQHAPETGKVLAAELRRLAAP